MDINNTLRTLLAKNIVRFTYRKVDGTLRQAIGTRNLDLARNYYNGKGIDHYIPTPKGAEQPYSYYDLEKMAWRSYKPSNLISIDGLVESTTRTEIPVVDCTREIPVQKPVKDDSVKDINGIIGSIFGGGIGIGGGELPPCFGKGTEEKIRKAMEDLDAEIGFGKPTDIGYGIGIPVNKGDMDIRDFARVLADLIVENLLARLSR